MNFKYPSKKTIMLIFLVAVITLLLNSVLAMWLRKVTDLKVPTIGKIKTIGIEAYWDKDLKNKTNAINWNIIWLGSSKNVTIFLRSISNERTVLKLNTMNWYPDNISKYMNISWNYDEVPLDPGDIIQITISVSVPPSVSSKEYIIKNNVNEFSFDIIIQAIEY